MTEITQPRARIALLWILALALSLRLIVPLIAYEISGDTSVFHNPDTVEYVLPAKSLLSTGSYSVGGVPEILRTPGYSILLIPGIILGRLTLVTILLQAALSVFTIYLVYRIGLLMWESPRVAVLAAALYAVEPLSITYASFLFTETFFTTLLTAAIFFLMRNLTFRKWPDLILSGALFAAATYVRPISMFLPFLITGGLIIWAALKEQWSRRFLIQAVTLSAVFVMLVVPWQVRNYVETGFFGFSDISDNNLHFSTQAAILSYENGVPFLDQQYSMGFTDPDLYFSLHPEQREWSQAQIVQWRRRQGIESILQHPRTYLLLALEAAVWAIRDTAATGYLTLFNVQMDSGWGWRASVGLKALLATLLLGYYFFAGTAVVLRGLFKDARITCLTGICAYFILAAAATCIGFARFRLPIMPILCALAAYGIATFLQRVPWLKLNSRLQCFF